MGWFYYALHTGINTIKKMFRSTVLVILIVIIGCGVVFGLAGSMIGNIMEKQDATEISTEAVQENEEDDGEEAGEQEMSAEDVRMVKTFAEAGIAVLFLVLLLAGIYSGSKNGTEIFQMADVNFLFTAPVKPQSVLLFRLSFQMVASVFASVYLVFQIPNLTVNLGLGAFAVTAVIIGWVFLLIFQKLMTVLSYTVFTTHERLKKYVIPAIWTFAAMLLGILAVLFFVSGRNPYRVAEMSFGSLWMRYVPVIGWLKGMIMSAADGQTVSFFVYLLLLVFAVFVLVFFIWRIQADFYEDALSAAGKTAERLTAAQEGRMVQGRKRSDRIRREGTLTGWGGEVFFTKEVYCRRRMAVFGFFTKTMLFYLAVSVLVSVLISRTAGQGFSVVGIILVCVLFFRNMGNPIEQETANNWLFLVPDNPYKKVFSAMLAGTYSCAMDLFFGVLVSGMVIGEKPLLLFLWYITLCLLDFMFSAAGLLLEAAFHSSAFDMVKAMIQMFLRFFLILFVVFPMAGGYFLGGWTAALVLMDVAAVLLGGTAFVIYPALLHRGRQ